MSTMRNLLGRFDNAMLFVQNVLRDRDNRWVLLVTTVLVMMLLRALGSAGLADVIGLVYIMYFVTFWRPQ